MIARTLYLFIYRMIVAHCGVLIAVTVGQVFIPKVRAGLRLRRMKRDWPTFSYPPIWIHTSSGEFEYAKPVIREIKLRHPNQPIVVTYFSPSYERAISRFPGVDFSLPLPLDLPGPTRAFLQKLKPAAGFIARTDLWPELLTQAKSLRIPMVLFSVTKTRVPGFAVRSFQKWLYGSLKTIFCVSEADAENVRRIAPNVPCVAVGDTRFDQAIQRLQSPKPVNESLKPERHQTLVAGSTWAEDEKILIPALQDLLKKGELRLIIAPHEPTVSHIEELISQFMKRGIPVEIFSKASHFTSGVLIVDQVGVLAELYQWGALAFVGGSFKGSVHSVMEPLAAGALTIVGPHHRNNREAIDFQSRASSGLPFVQVAKDSSQLSAIVTNALATLTDEFSSQLRQEIKARSGASRRLVDLIERKERPIEPSAQL